MHKNLIKKTISILASSFLFIGCVGAQQSNISNKFLERTVVAASKTYDEKLFDGIIFMVFMEPDLSGKYQITGIFGRIAPKMPMPDYFVLLKDGWTVLKDGSYNQDTTLVYYIQEDNKYNGISTIETAQDRAFRKMGMVIPSEKDKSLIYEARAFKDICLNFDFIEDKEYKKVQYNCRKMAEAKHAGQGQYDIRIEVAEGCEDKYISKTFNSRPRIEDFVICKE